MTSNLNQTSDFRKLNAIFVDFDGTICFDQFWHNSGRQVVEFVSHSLFGELTDRVQAWMRGETDSEEINSWLAAELGLNYDSLWREFEASCRQFWVEPAILLLIELIRKEGLKTVLVTDNMDCFSRFTEPTLNLKKYFCHIVNSADYGHLKKSASGNLFATARELTGVPYHEILLLDNSQANCLLFANLGGQTRCVTGAEDTKAILGAVLSARLICGLDSHPV